MTSNTTKSRRRTFSDSSHKLIVKNDEIGLLKKSLSSTLEVPGISISKQKDLPNDGYDSLEDLFNDTLTLKIANTRHYYCDIFSRQSIGSEDAGSSPDVDDDERINFLASIPDSARGCEIIQLIPKKPTVVISNAIYQPECTNIQKILKSSCSAFRDISEIKILKSQSADDLNDKDEEKKADSGGDGGNSSSQA